MALFDARPRAAARPPARIVGAMWLTISLHLALALALTVIARRQDPPSTASAAIPPHLPEVVWLATPGPSGGLRGGEPNPQPASRIERPGTDVRTIPARAPQPFVARTRSNDEPPPQQIDIPALPEASNLRDVPGALTAVSLLGVASRGPGSSDGVGGGGGPGLGRASGAYAGDGPGGPGSNILPPELISQVRPNYTSAALQARVRGIVGMEAIVLPDGSVGEVRVIRSLDRDFGLDQEAIKAVKLWRFRPATRLGKAVPMYVSIEMTFELR